MYYLEDNIILTPLERLEPANYDLLSMHYKKKLLSCTFLFTIYCAVEGGFCA